MTIEKILSREADAVILDIELELLSGKVPATGYAHSYCRKLNRLIDAGECCINPTTYRKVYLPTLAKLVQKECARRWTNIIIREQTV
mgnify:CR=1 FL=1